MVSGSGDIDCFFDVFPTCGGVGTEELSHYLNVWLRLEIGSTFTGIFIAGGQCTTAVERDERVKERELFYKCDCVITEVGIEVNTEDEIHSEISL